MQRRFWGTILSNLFEHYDTALFSLLAPFLAPLFFPNQDPVTALLFTFGIIPLGMAARPIGALFFGYIGDSIGRRKTLEISLIGTAVVSILMGLLPTYAQWGTFAPVLLSLGRIGQNFFAAGEITGGIVYLLEKSDQKKQDFISSLYDASTIAGILLASCLVSLLYALDVMDSYWRCLYFLSDASQLSLVFYFAKMLFMMRQSNLHRNRYYFSLKSSGKCAILFLRSLLPQAFPMLAILYRL